jgi:hypothetical protein
VREFANVRVVTYRAIAPDRRTLSGMRADDAVVTAVLATLLRATVDARTPVVLRSRRAAQARELSRWLAAAHGSARTVVIASAGPSVIEVRLPARLVWPRVTPALRRDDDSIAGLAAARPAAHYSPMAHDPMSDGTR